MQRATGHRSRAEGELQDGESPDIDSSGLEYEDELADEPYSHYHQRLRQQLFQNNTIHNSPLAKFSDTPMTEPWNTFSSSIPPPPTVIKRSFRNTQQRPQSSMASPYRFTPSTPRNTHSNVLGNRRDKLYSPQLDDPLNQNRRNSQSSDNYDDEDLDLLVNASFDNNNNTSNNSNNPHDNSTSTISYVDNQNTTLNSSDQSFNLGSVPTSSTPITSARSVTLPSTAIFPRSTSLRAGLGNSVSSPGNTTYPSIAHKQQQNQRNNAKRYSWGMDIDNGSPSSYMQQLQRDFKRGDSLQRSSSVSTSNNKPGGLWDDLESIKERLRKMKISQGIPVEGQEPDNDDISDSFDSQPIDLRRETSMPRLSNRPSMDRQSILSTPSQNLDRSSPAGLNEIHSSPHSANNHLYNNDTDGLNNGNSGSRAWEHERGSVSSINAKSRGPNISANISTHSSKSNTSTTAPMQTDPHSHSLSQSAIINSSSSSSSAPRTQHTSQSYQQRSLSRSRSRSHSQLNKHHQQQQQHNQTPAERHLTEVLECAKRSARNTNTNSNGLPNSSTIHTHITNSNEIIGNISNSETESTSTNALMTYMLERAASDVLALYNTINRDDTLQLDSLDKAALSLAGFMLQYLDVLGASPAQQQYSQLQQPQELQHSTNSPSPVLAALSNQHHQTKVGGSRSASRASRQYIPPTPRAGTSLAFYSGDANTSGNSSSSTGIAAGSGVFDYDHVEYSPSLSRSPSTASRAGRFSPATAFHNSSTATTTNGISSGFVTRSPTQKRISLNSSSSASGSIPGSSAAADFYHGQGSNSDGSFSKEPVPNSRKKTSPSRRTSPLEYINSTSPPPSSSASSTSSSSSSSFNGGSGAFSVGGLPGLPALPTDAGSNYTPTQVMTPFNINKPPAALSRFSGLHGGAGGPAVRRLGLASNNSANGSPSPNSNSNTTTNSFGSPAGGPVGGPLSLNNYPSINATVPATPRLVSTSTFRQRTNTNSNNTPHSQIPDSQHQHQHQHQNNNNGRHNSITGLGTGPTGNKRYSLTFM